MAVLCDNHKVAIFQKISCMWKELICTVAILPYSEIVEQRDKACQDTQDMIVVQEH